MRNPTNHRKAQICPPSPPPPNLQKILKVTVGSMIVENTAMFSNCFSSQAMTDRNLKLGRVVEKASKYLKRELF